MAVIESAVDVPYRGLLPEVVLQLAESAGLQPDGRLFALNSYENRVYRLGIDDAAPLVLKFYRANRWSDAQILEEHEFACELAAAELPVVAPIKLGNSTLYKGQGFRMAAFPLRAGAAPELDASGSRTQLGRAMARIHAIGARRDFNVRPALGDEWLGARARRIVLTSAWLPAHCAARYEAISQQLYSAVLAEWEQHQEVRFIRLHGDCHLGNILWNESGPLFVDLDDCLAGPAIQDLWMFLSGNGDEQRRQWAELVEGYEQFADFDYQQLRLIEALRATRMMNHAAWITERWTDPAFPRAFPWFAEPAYWERHIADLAEQIELVGQPPLLAM
jgi:Ser/Thr protein kinase RdoA (MazF antagonist)